MLLVAILLSLVLGASRKGEHIDNYDAQHNPAAQIDGRHQDSKCPDAQFLTPSGKCVADCAIITGYYNNTEKFICDECSPTCLTCVGTSGNCTACPPRFVLQFINGISGICIEECTESDTIDGCERCGAVIKGSKYCSKCKIDSFFPGNGQCSDKLTSKCKDGADGVCKKCESGYFLYEGGCYSPMTQPGIEICKEPDDNSGGCKTCTNGLSAENGKCPRCHPTCATCFVKEASNKCATCSSGYYKKNDSSDCIKCSAGNEPNNTSRNCAFCEYKSSQFSCLAKFDPSLCIYQAPNCLVCKDERTCRECDDGLYLTESSQCTNDCALTGRYYGDQYTWTCQKCSDKCRTCVSSDDTSCTSCPEKKMLQYSENDKTRGTCIDECKADSTAGCKTCGASIGNTAYCSQCSGANQAPLNGVCTENSAKATKFCNALSDGQCTQCANGFFLFKGGCYNVSQQPGMEVCQTASNGLCTKCANGLPADTGNCTKQKCHNSCATCSGTGANDCNTCANGYYKEGNGKGQCSRCDTEIPSCAICAYINRQFVCLMVKPANKTGISTGGVAGIIIAVVLIVGGVIGFLCWRFLCSRQVRVGLLGMDN